MFEYSGLGNENGIMMRHKIEAGTSCHGGFGIALAADLIRTGLSLDVLENVPLRAVIKARMKVKRDAVLERRRKLQAAAREKAREAKEP